VKVPDLHSSDSDKPPPAMAGALGLAAASVSTAHCLQVFSDLLIGGKGTNSCCHRNIDRRDGPQ
jgi:hypothetical protein